MPLYEYVSDDGDVLEVRRSVESRNIPIMHYGVIFRRSKTIPERISIHGIGPTQEQQFNADILRGWYAREQEQGTRLDTGEFTKQQIKDAWSE